MAARRSVAALALLSLLACLVISEHGVDAAHPRFRSTKHVSARSRARNQFLSCQKEMAKLIVDLEPGKSAKTADMALGTCSFTAVILFEALSSRKPAPFKPDMKSSESSFAQLLKVIDQDLPAAVQPGAKPKVFMFNFAAPDLYWSHAFLILSFPGGNAPFRVIQSFVDAYSYFDWLGDADTANAMLQAKRITEDTKYQDACTSPKVNVAAFKAVCEKYGRSFVTLAEIQDLLRKIEGTFQLLGHKADSKVPDYDKFYEQAEVMFGAKKEDSFRYNVRDKLSKAQPSLVSLQADSADLTSDKCANLIGNLEKAENIQFQKEGDAAAAVPSAPAPPGAPNPAAGGKPTLRSWSQEKLASCTLDKKKFM